MPSDVVPSYSASMSAYSTNPPPRPFTPAPNELTGPSLARVQLRQEGNKWCLKRFGSHRATECVEDADRGTQDFGALPAPGEKNDPREVREAAGQGTKATTC